MELSSLEVAPHFIIGCAVHDINDPCLLRIRTIEVPHSQPQNEVLLVASWNLGYVPGVGANLSVRSRATQHILPLLTAELSPALILQQLCPLSQEMPITLHWLERALCNIFNTRKKSEL
jgi:hypothetical protein